MKAENIERNSVANTTTQAAYLQNDEAHNMSKNVLFHNGCEPTLVGQ